MYLIIFEFMNWKLGSLGSSRSKVHSGVGPLAELIVTRHKVSMEMSLQDTFQGKVLSFQLLVWKEREREREKERCAPT